MPDITRKMGTIIAGEFYDAAPDFVLTMETKGIPVALMTAQSMDVPLVIARRSSKVYEGSAVNINYASGSAGHIETMEPQPPRGEGRPEVPDRGRLPQGRRHGQRHG